MCRKLMAPAHLVPAPESLANGFQASLSMSHSNTFGTTISRHSMTHNHHPPTFNMCIAIPCINASHDPLH